MNLFFGPSPEPGAGRPEQRPRPGASRPPSGHAQLQFASELTQFDSSVTPAESTTVLPSGGIA